jgi:FixJ family two-component response regulator
VEALRALHCAVPTIIITSDGDVPTAVSAIRAGAVDFIERPFADRQILTHVEAALEALPVHR